MRLRLPAEATRRRARRSARRSTRSFAQRRRARPTSSTPRASPTALTAEERRGRAPGATPGCSGRKQFYHYVVARLARGRSRPAAAAGRARATGRNSRLAAPLQPRRHLDAGQVGVPLVRRLGPRVPHDPVRAHRSRTSPRSSSLLLLREWYMHPNGQLPAYEFAFGDVNPPVHAWAVLARLQDDRRRAASATALFLARVLPEAAAQLHLVGQPQGRRGQATSSPAASSASTTSASSTARKPLPDRRPPRAGRRHRLDGVLLRDHALDGAGAGAARTRPTRTSPPSSSSTSSPSPTP